MAGIMCLSSPSLQTVRFVNKPTNCVRWNSAARTVAVLAEEAVSPTNGSRLTTGTLCAVTVARKIADACGGCPVEIFSVSSDGRGAELTAQEASRIHVNVHDYVKLTVRVWTAFYIVNTLKYPLIL